MADETTDTDQIERDLAHTRARMDRRLDELGERLAPNQLVNDALSQVSGGDGADFTRTLIAKARSNPLPAALAGIGIVWLLTSSETKRHQEPDLQARLRSAEAGVVRLDDEHPDVHASRLDDARGQVLGIARNASDTSASYAQRIKDAITSAAQSARQTSHDVRNSAAHTLSKMGDDARSGGYKMSTGAQSLTENPVVIGAAAALVGLVAGALLPMSDQEERALGSLAGRVRTRGRDLAQNVLDRSAQVAGDALGAAKDSAKAQGLSADKPVGQLVSDLTSGDLIGQVKQVAHDAVDAGKSSMQAKAETGDNGER